MQAENIPVINMEINVSLVQQLLSTQFPQWEDLSIRPVEFDGWDNRTFHLGEKMSVRLPSAAWYAAQVEKEQYWLPKLAPQLPLSIPAPIAMGKPGENYPWNWSIYQWIEGENAGVENINNLDEFAADLAAFLAALQYIEPAGGPPPGEHNFFRGGSLSVYDQETRSALTVLSGKINTDMAAEIWDKAIDTVWQYRPVWVHGDIAAGNMLVKEGRLNAVIDFGCSAVGDPACDLTIAWTLFSGASRETFFTALPFDRATWARARGWALWKALITLAEYIETDSHKAENARYVLNEVMEDYRAAR